MSVREESSVRLDPSWDVVLISGLGDNVSPRSGFAPIEEL